MANKPIKSLLSVVLAGLLLSSCLKIQQIDGGSGPETDPVSPQPTPGTETPGTDPEPDPLTPVIDPDPEENRIANFDLELLTEQNLISSLLSRYDSVTVRKEYESGGQTESLWLRDGDIVYFVESKEIYEGEEYFNQSVDYRGYYIYPDPEDVTTCSRWISAEPEAYVGGPETLLTDYLPYETAGDILVLDEDEETVTVLLPELLVAENGAEIPCENTLTVNKGTLDIYSFRWEYTLDGELYYGSFSVEYDGEKLGTDVMEAWDDTRSVNVNVLTEAGGERVENFEIPAAWGLLLYQDEGMILSSPDAAAGMAVDESMYIEPGGNTVTVYAWDEANYPADVVTEPDSLDELPFSMDTLRENNRITNLLNKYGTLVLDNTTEYGEYSTSFFRYGQVIIRYSYMEFTDEDGTVYRQGTGNYDRDEFELNGDGESYSYIALVPNPDEADYLFYDTNADGEHYAYDTTLTDSLMLGTASDIQSDGDTVSFRYQYDFDEEGESVMNWVVGREDAIIRSVDFGNMSMSETVRPGADVPFQKEFEDAFSKTRIILCHFEGIGDYDYIIPADWAFSVSSFLEELTCYSDPAMKQVRETSIPGDGKNYEIWIRVGETAEVPPAPEPAPTPEPEPDPAPAPEPTPEPAVSEPDSLALYAGTWKDENDASEIRINPDGSFFLLWGGDGCIGTLEWTDEDAGLWARGGRYALILTDGTPMTGDGFVTSDGEQLDLCIGGGAERLRRMSLVGVRKVEAGAKDLGPHDTFPGDRGEYAVEVLLEAYDKVSDFRVYSLKNEGTDEGSIPTFSATELYRYASFTPEKSLLLTMTFGEIYPTYGFSYKDAAGEVHTFGIIESGMDGSAILMEIRAAMG